MDPHAESSNHVPGLNQRAKGSSRRAAQVGKAKTKVLFAHYQHSDSEKGINHSLSYVDKRMTLDGGEHLSVVCETSLSRAPRTPLLPPFHPDIHPPPPLPRGWISVAFGTWCAVQMTPRSSKPQPPQLPSPSKKRLARQIPSQGSHLSPDSENSDEVLVELDDLIHPSRDELTSSPYTGFVVLRDPEATTHFSRPVVLFEPPPPTKPPRSFLYDYFAKMVDKEMPDDCDGYLPMF